MSDASPPDIAAMAAPTEAHEKMAPFAGTFRAEVKIWMGPGEPSVSTGTMVNSWDLGGRFLKQHYTGDASEGPFPNFEGRGYWGYNKSTRRYEGFWIDNASTMMQSEIGELDASGKVWTMVGEVTGPQGPVKKRSVLTLEDDDHHRMEMYFSTPEGESKGMEIRYTRAE